MEGGDWMEDCLNCCPNNNEFLVTDNFCGNFSLACGDTNNPIWGTDELVTFGTLSIFYLGGCAEAIIVTVIDSSGNIDMFEVPPKNTRSRTYANLVSVRLACPGAGTYYCEGSYCLNLHYSTQDGGHLKISQDM
jgi:Protein of unknown function (DUF3992)